MLTLGNRIGATRSWNGQYTIPCEKVPELPDFTFVFGGKPYPLAGTDYILNLGNQCVSAFTGMDINLPGGELWIVGMYQPFEVDRNANLFLQVTSS